MYKYSRQSEEKLYTCHQDLIFLFHNIIETWDTTIISGHRGPVEQNELYAKGYSKVRWPKGKHNSDPSDAVDAAPYGCWGPDRPRIVWPKRPRLHEYDNIKNFLAAYRLYTKDLAVWYMWAGYILGKADELGIAIRYGGDWDGDKQINDQNFDDLGHFERV